MDKAHAIEVAEDFVSKPEEPKERIVYLTRAELERLDEYSCTLPTGPSIGRQWRRKIPWNAREHEPHTWWHAKTFRCVEPEFAETHYDTVWSRIVITDDFPTAAEVFQLCDA